MIKLSGSRFTDIMPENLAEQPEIQALAYAVGRQVEKLLAYADGARTYAAIYAVPEKVLDLLAVELRTPSYDENFSIKVKRTLIAESLLFYAQMGTPAAVNRIIETIFQAGHISEWWEYGGKPYHFKAYTTNPAITSDDVEGVQAGAGHRKAPFCLAGRNRVGSVHTSGGGIRGPLDPHGRFYHPCKGRLCNRRLSAMFQAPKLTDAGKNLYYRNMAGEGIKFTTIQLGNGTISGPISAMTALVSAVVTIDAAVKNNAEQYADVSGHFSNAELEEGFYWREIGVFAADPDYPNDRSHDILYCYQNAYDTADFIPVASVETVEKNITVPIIVGDASTVSCTLSSSQVLVSEADLEAHDKDANAHNALFEKINKELEKKQDTITAKGILKGDQDAKGNPTVTKATPGVDYQQPTQVLTESNAMALTDTVPFSPVLTGKIVRSR